MSCRKLDVLLRKLLRHFQATYDSDSQYAATIYPNLEKYEEKSSGHPTVKTVTFLMNFQTTQYSNFQYATSIYPIQKKWEEKGWGHPTVKTVKALTCNLRSKLKPNYKILRSCGFVRLGLSYVDYLMLG